MNINQQIFEKIRSYSTVVIFGHTSPDGDCYGAQCGLKRFLKEVFPEKEILMTGSGFSRALPYFDAMDLVTEEQLRSALAVVVDVSDLERIEDGRILLCPEAVKFDHHLNSDRPSFASLNHSDTTASSACQMIGQFVLDNGFRISRDVGEPLFTGIVTDTGRFLYLNSSRGLFHVADEIMQAGIDFQKIFDFLYESDELSTRAKGFISCNFVSDGGVAYIVLPQSRLKALGISSDYAASMVNCMSGMKEDPIWAMFTEAADGVVRVELRSRKYNVQQVAVQFQGGGHLFASGCRLARIEDYPDVVEALKKLIVEEEVCGKEN